MRAHRLLISTVVCAGLVLLASWHLKMPLEKAALAAPIIVLAVGAAAFLVVLWTKIVVDALRRSR